MLKFGNTYLNFGGTYLDGWTAYIDPNPLNLPTNTMRVRCYPGTELSSKSDIFQLTKVGMEGDCPIYDIVTNENKWGGLAEGIIASANGLPKVGISDILGVNNSAISSVYAMFYWSEMGVPAGRTVAFSSMSSICYFDMSNVVKAEDWFNGLYSLTGLPKYNTSSVTSFSESFIDTNIPQPITLDCRSCVNLNDAFYYYGDGSYGFPDLKNTNNVSSWGYTFDSVAKSTALASKQVVIPDYDFSNAKNVSNTFRDNFYVSGGISSTYAKLSALGNQVTAHSRCFYGCGVSSEQGRAELALIPSDWK